MSDIERSVTGAIKYLLSQFPCVAIIGARQAGKTTLLKQVLPNAVFYDLENEHDFSRINADPLFFLNEELPPVILDEAQLCPDLFKALRVKIDQNRKTNGQFLISGSSSPELLSNLSETLAGRVAIFELGTFTWNESWKKPPSKLYDYIVSGKIDKISQLKGQYDAKQLYSSCLLGGYPEPFLQASNTKFYDIWMDNYFKTYINRDVRRLFPNLKIETYKRFIKMLSFSSGQIINLSDFARSLDVSQPTIKHYFEIAEGTFLWRQIRSYEKSKTKSIIKMPKGHVRDLGIVTHLLNFKTIDDLRAYPQFGRLWEAFVTEQIIKGLMQTLVPFQYYYFRTKNQAEIDLIIEGKFGVIPIEIKSGAKTDPYQLFTLKKFIQDHNCPLGILINQAEKIVNLSSSLVQIPVACL